MQTPPKQPLPPSYNPDALAPYACHASQSLGRLYDEETSPIRTPFQRDRDRVLHSSAFRRLKQKTQVFISHEGDHFRTRLTHTLEVAQLARTLARTLRIDEDLAEAIALAHDLGHTPFAHMGEERLSECMSPYGDFEHNDQSLRIVTTLEERYPEWDGLNLSWETLEGIVKHNGPLDTTHPLPYTLASFNKQMDLRLNTYASLEAQAAAIADDIAYNCHDIEDGLFEGIFTLDEISAHVPLVATMLAERRALYPDLSGNRLIHDVVRKLYGKLMHDVDAQTHANIAAEGPKSADDVRNAGRVLVSFSSEMAEHVKAMRAYLMPHMYHHYTVRRMRSKAAKIVGDLFDYFIQEPLSLPKDWHKRLPNDVSDKTATARVVCDYISGMTDRMAMLEHERIFNLYDTRQHG